MLEVFEATCRDDPEGIVRVVFAWAFELSGRVDDHDADGDDDHHDADDEQCIDECDFFGDHDWGSGVEIESSEAAHARTASTYCENSSVESVAVLLAM